ncbi:MAG: hypothetical protein O3A13_15020 [Proteobacteria bacterium]|nr:hypothetical protein [Pseudomonadota bacterium]
MIEQPRIREIVKPEDIPVDDYTVEMSCGAELSGRVESGGPGKNVLMPDIYGDRHDATEPLLKILDQSSPDVDISTGFNPYDTVVLHEKPGSKKH